MISDLDNIVFRSFTEVFWAALITESGYSLQYEPNTYLTRHGFYCPDFYVEELDLIIEIKGKRPTETEFEKLADVEHQTKSSCIFLCDIPELLFGEIQKGEFYSSVPGRAIPVSWMWNIDKGDLFLAAFQRAKSYIRKPCLVTRYLASGELSGNYKFVEPGSQPSIQAKVNQDPWLSRSLLFIETIKKSAAEA